MTGLEQRPLLVTEQELLEKGCPPCGTALASPCPGLMGNSGSFRNPRVAALVFHFGSRYEHMKQKTP